MTHMIPRRSMQMIRALKETDSDTFLLPLPLGRDILLSPGKIISSVIHE